MARLNIAATVWLIGGIAMVGCVPEGERTEPLPQWNPDDEPTDPTGPTIPQSVGALKLSIPLNVDYPMRLREIGTEDGPCELEVDGTRDSDGVLRCLIDINELDLYGNGLDFDFTVPAGACDHITYGHYLYEAFEVGIGPTVVSYTRLPGGQVTDEVNSIGGVPYCVYDHKWRYQDGPNCCLGGYTLSVLDAATGIVTDTPSFWGGIPSDCYGGAAYIDPEATFNEAGFPFDKIIYVNRSAYYKAFHFDPLTGFFISNVPLASHYLPGDHAGDKPAGFNDLLQIAREYHVFECWDHDKERMGRLELQVREYNTLDAFDEDGDPNVVGTESNGLPLDDFADWATATPGNQTRIEIFE